MFFLLSFPSGPLIHPPRVLLSLRKSNPANLALLGVLVSSSAKCFLNKAIFEYMVESTRAKKARQIASAQWKRNPFVAVRQASRLVSSLHSIRKAKINRIAVEQQGKGGLANGASLASEASSVTSSCNANANSGYTRRFLPDKKGAEGEDKKGLVSPGAGAAEVKIDSDEVTPFKASR